MTKPPHIYDRPKSIYRRPSRVCRWCGYGCNDGKIICEHCRALDPDRAARVAKDERR